MSRDLQKHKSFQRFYLQALPNSLNKVTIKREDLVNGMNLNHKKKNSRLLQHEMTKEGFDKSQQSVE
jgi:hypothetical protein